MIRGLAVVVATFAVAILVVTSVLALPLLGVSAGPFGGAQSDAAGQDDVTNDTTALDAEDQGEFEPVSMEPTSASADAADDGAEPTADGGGETDATATSDAGDGATASLAQEQVDAVEAGVDEGIELAESQGVEVSQEQREAAIEGASESAAQHQAADAEQVQAATAGAVHGSLIQEQSIEVEQIQYAVGGATEGALAQYQSAEASQLQSATWGATHGALAQSQRVDVEQIQVATRGAAAGAAAEAGDKDVDSKPKIQEAAQGAAYGALEQYQTITVEQRQRVTLEHVQHAAAGASAGALEGSTEAVLDQEQRVEAEQYQRIDIKQVQKAAVGAAKGALVQRQEVSVEQTQAAARGAGRGSLKQLQTVTVEQVQRISITQIQEASFGAAKGSIAQSQEATVEQIQAAADGAAGGVLVQRQEISITQIQAAAVGASEGAIESAIQYQSIEIEQIQAAAFGAGEGAVLQRQVVDVTQVQALASGGASGALIQYQEATVEQIQLAARGACEETARAVQYQRISITQLQILTQETAADATSYAIQEGLDGADDAPALSQYLEVEVEQRVETVDEPEGEASVAFDDQESDGESVVVDSVDLSEGGFVAVYPGDAVAEPGAALGSSDALAAGEHADVEVDLAEPLESDRSLVAVVHHDTTGDGTFQYAESDGEEDGPYVAASGAPVLDTAFVTVGEETAPGDGNETDPGEPNATLSVTDQTGDGENLTVDEASADVGFSVTASADGSEAESEAFDANETVADLELDLEPPLTENASIDVSVVGENDTELATETVDYTVEGEEPNETDPNETDPGEPNATLEVANQTGDGENLTVEEANASVDYALEVTDEDGEQRAASEPFPAGESVELESLALEPPLEENATLDVAVVDENGTALAEESVEYAVDGGPEAFDVEFVDCQRAEVTGSFEDGDAIIVATGFYESSGFGNSMGEYGITVGDHVAAPFEGTITYETGDDFTVEETADGANVTVPEGEFGAAITGFASPDALAGEIDHPNPDASDCIAEVRPERPEINVNETTPTDDGIDVTFGYDNPNNATVFVDSEFVEGTTADEPIEELEPGEGTFTVEWTPESDDERLVWEAGLEHYDYEEPLTAETETAGEIEPSDPAAAEPNATEPQAPAGDDPVGEEPVDEEATADGGDDAPVAEEPTADSGGDDGEPAGPSDAPNDSGAATESPEPADPSEPTETQEPTESEPAASEAGQDQTDPTASDAATEPEPDSPASPDSETESGANASEA